MSLLHPASPTPCPARPPSSHASRLLSLISLLPFLYPHFPITFFFIFPPNVYPSVILLFPAQRYISLSLRLTSGTGRASGSIHSVILRVNKVSVNTRLPQRSFPSQSPRVIVFIPATHDETKQRLRESLVLFCLRDEMTGYYKTTGHVSMLLILYGDWRISGLFFHSLFFIHFVLLYFLALDQLSSLTSKFFLHLLVYV